VIKEVEVIKEIVREVPVYIDRTAPAAPASAAAEAPGATATTAKETSEHEAGGAHVKGKVSALLSMGFPAHLAKNALEASGGSLDAAAALLLDSDVSASDDIAGGDIAGGDTPAPPLPVTTTATEAMTAASTENAPSMHDELDALAEVEVVNRETREMLRMHAANFLARHAGDEAVAYEAWIAQLHPENVKIDERLIAEGCEHQQIWQEALCSRGFTQDPTEARAKEAVHTMMHPMRTMLTMMHPCHAMRAMMHPMHTMRSMHNEFASATGAAALLAAMAPGAATTCATSAMAHWNALQVHGVPSSA